MIKINGMPAGDFVREVRKQRGMTQDALAAGIFDRSHLSKLERNQHIPPMAKLAQVVERLGFNPDIIGTDKQQQKNKLDSYLSRRETTPTAQLLAELEADDDFMDSPRNQQFIQTTKAAIAIIEDKAPHTIMPIIKMGLKVTLPDFNDRSVAKYLLTDYDIQLINQLALIYWRMKYKDAAINLLYALIANFDTICLDPIYRARHYPTLAYNLSKYLHETKRYNEAIPLCDKGIEVCLDIHALLMLPQLFCNKAHCLQDLGDVDGSLELFRQAFYLFNAYKLYEYKEMTRNHIKKSYGIQI